MKRDYKKECFDIIQSSDYEFFKLYHISDVSVIHLEELLYIASSNNMLDILEVVIASGIDLNGNDEWNDEKDTALHTAASNGNLECVKMLVEANANINMFNVFGQPPLRQAVYNKKSDVSLYLLDNACDFLTPDFKGVTILELAERKKLTSVVEKIEEYSLLF